MWPIVCPLRCQVDILRQMLQLQKTFHDKINPCYYIQKQKHPTKGVCDAIKHGKKKPCIVVPL